VYYVDCICGHPIESEAIMLICSHCQRLIVIDWPARGNTVDRPPSIHGLKLCSQFESAPTGSISEEPSTS
jgi:hypothetical protein